jgi:hypothetical protein
MSMLSDFHVWAVANLSGNNLDPVPYRLPINTFAKGGQKAISAAWSALNVVVIGSSTVSTTARTGDPAFIVTKDFGSKEYMLTDVAFVPNLRVLAQKKVGNALEELTVPLCSVWSQLACVWAWSATLLLSSYPRMVGTPGISLRPTTLLL